MRHCHVEAPNLEAVKGIVLKLDKQNSPPKQLKNWRDDKLENSASEAVKSLLTLWFFQEILLP